MKPYIWLALLGYFLSGVAFEPCVAASSIAADESQMSDTQKEQIRAIVREVLHEYAATLNSAQEQHERARVGLAQANGILGDIRQSNRNFVRTHGPDYFKPFLDSQHPRATVVACSDSRFQTHVLHDSPDDNLFMVRDIGNQIATAEGSVEYGIHHLHTPLLLIVGHSACGAVKAAAGDYSQESAPIRRELDSLQVPKGEPGMGSIHLNVNYQVRAAMSKYQGEVLSGQLTVVGAIYDFTNEMKQGQGKLNIINVNGDTDPARIAALEWMQGPTQASLKGPKARHRRAKKAKAAATDEPSASKRDH